MIQFNGENNIQEIHYNGRDIRKVYDHLGKVWEKRPPDYPNEYLTIRVLEKIYTAEGCDISLHRSSGCTVELKYSVNGGAWTTYTSAITGLQEGDVVRLKGHVVEQIDTASTYGAYGTLHCYYHNVEVEGNIMSLLYEDNFSGQTDLMYDYIFVALFAYNPIVTAENLVLPSTVMTNSCYYGMFDGCRSLTTAPQLRATTLADQCCCNMFIGCSSLEKAPTLLATTLVAYCYELMFNGCSSLNHIECHATDISAFQCTTSWLDGVAENGTFITPSSTNWSSGRDGIPASWTRVDL